MHSINDWNKPNVFLEEITNISYSYEHIMASNKECVVNSYWEKGNCKRTCETYWAYYGKYAGPSIQNTDPICKVYITENIYGHHPYILWVIEKSNMKPTFIFLLLYFHIRSGLGMWGNIFRWRNYPLAKFMRGFNIFLLGISFEKSSPRKVRS